MKLREFFKPNSGESYDAGVSVTRDPDPGKTPLR